MSKTSGKAWKATDIPNVPHWVIVKERQVTEYSGYEKEGESGDSVTVFDYEYYTDEKAWEAEVAHLSTLKPTYAYHLPPGFKAMKVYPAEITVKVTTTVTVK